MTSGNLHETSRNRLRKACAWLYLSPLSVKSHIYWPFPSASWTVSQRSLWCCLSGYSLHFYPQIKLILQLSHCALFFFKLDKAIGGRWSGMTAIFIKRKSGHRHTQGRPCEDARRRQISIRWAWPQKKPNLRTPWSWLSSFLELLKHKSTLKSSSLGYFVTVAPAPPP